MRLREELAALKDINAGLDRVARNYRILLAAKALREGRATTWPEAIRAAALEAREPAPSSMTGGVQSEKEPK